MSRNRSAARGENNRRAAELGFNMAHGSGASPTARADNRTSNRTDAGTDAGTGADIVAAPDGVVALSRSGPGTNNASAVAQSDERQHRPDDQLEAQGILQELQLANDSLEGSFAGFNQHLRRADDQGRQMMSGGTNGGGDYRSFARFNQHLRRADDQGRQMGLGGTGRGGARANGPERPHQPRAGNGGGCRAPGNVVAIVEEDPESPSPRQNRGPVDPRLQRVMDEVHANTERYNAAMDHIDDLRQRADDHEQRLDDHDRTRDEVFERLNNLELRRQTEDGADDEDDTDDDDSD